MGCYGGDNPGLLIAGDNFVDGRDVERCAKNAAFVPVVSGENPEAVLPPVVNDVVDVADGVPGKGVSHVPGETGIARCIDEDFVASGIVEIFSPEHRSVR